MKAQIVSQLMFAFVVVMVFALPTFILFGPLPQNLADRLPFYGAYVAIVSAVLMGLFEACPKSFPN